MNEPALQAQIDAAKTYEALMVPAVFGQWASKVADAVRIQPGQRVLDVACGTGALAREVASRTGPTGSVVGLDPSPGMLAVAKQFAPGIEWQEGLAESLPFPDHSFDAVVTQFGLMFVDDRRAALREATRVLARNGRLGVAVWDSLDRIPAYSAEVALLEQVAGRRAGEALRAPFVLGDRNDLAALFGDVGLVSVNVTTDRGTAKFPSVRIMVEADLRGWLPVMGVVLAEEKIASILEEAERVLEPYVSTDGTVAFDVSAHIVIGTKA